MEKISTIPQWGAWWFAVAMSWKLTSNLKEINKEEVKLEARDIDHYYTFEDTQEDFLDHDDFQALHRGINPAANKVDHALMQVKLLRTNKFDYLGRNAKKDVKKYSWEERAKKIIQFSES